jgi:hypothetical protein
MGLIRWAEDAGLSGGLAPAQRPALTEAITQLCDHQADVLVTAKLDRETSTIAQLGLPPSPARTLRSS